MKILVGYTGFVGSNIFEKGTFDAGFNSKNIEGAYGLHPDLLVYAGVRAEKYLANNEPDKDWELILQAEKNIELIAPKKLVLISTIDVFSVPKDVNEDSNVNINKNHAYGYDRYMLEQWVRTRYPDALIIRLPGLFGKNIKKNFIYDYLKRIPTMLKPNKLSEICKKVPDIKEYYELSSNGLYQCKQLGESEEKILREMIMKTGFSALDFTDSRSKYQFYPLSKLWCDIEIALANDILLLHLATEPISAGELYENLTGEKFLNELNGVPADYNYKTIYAPIFGGENGYICGRQEIMNEIKEFVYDYEYCE